MKKFLRILLFGIITWLIPFVSAFFFYTKDGQLNIDIYLFKTIMILVGSLSGALFIILYLIKVSNNLLKESILIGLAWLIINYLLDFIILLPMSGMALGEYFTQIGLRYLVLPIMSITVGYVADKKK